jgi:5-methylcytosine-specific restriction endonuclease McrA
LALRALNDEALVLRLEALVAQERESLVDVIEHLMEVDRRGVALDRGYGSLFEYCIRKLSYSEGAAYLRIRSARAAAKHPEILERLRSGRIHLDAVARLSPYLTEDNSHRMLDRIDGASKRDVLALVATLQSGPAPERDVIVPVGLSRSGEPEIPLIPNAAAPAFDASTAERPREVSSEDAHEPADVEVVAAPQHRFHFTADASLLALVSRLRGLLRHKYPDGRLEAIFKEAAATLLEKLERERTPIQRRVPSRRAGVVPKANRRGSRVVSRSIKRQVWAREGGQCAYVAPDGRRCESRDALEYDHILAWADGGRSDTIENIRLLCRAHNQRLARRRFGPRGSL